MEREKSRENPSPVIANGPQLPLEQAKEAINGQTDKLSDEGVGDENSAKSTCTSGLSEVEDYQDLSNIQEKSDTSSQLPLLEENMTLEEKPGPPNADPDPASQDSSSTIERQRGSSSLLETPTEGKLLNGSLNSSSQFENDSSKRDSDSGSTSASESMDLSISFSADLSLTRGNESLSLKVRIRDQILGDEDRSNLG